MTQDNAEEILELVNSKKIMQLVEKEENMKKNDVLLKPVEKDSLYLKISDAVYSYIKMNNLQPDDKLPSERDMAAMLQTSRNSVREGLRILEDRGLIYVKTGKRSFCKGSVWRTQRHFCPFNRMYHRRASGTSDDSGSSGCSECNQQRNQGRKKKARFYCV